MNDKVNHFFIFQYFDSLILGTPFFGFLSLFLLHNLWKYLNEKI